MHSPCPQRLCHPANISLPAGLLALILATTFVNGAWADTYLPPIGGDGGGQFSARCAEGELLIGVQLRVGDDVDAIRPLCVAPEAARDLNRVSNPSELKSDWHGGAGGGLLTSGCPSYEKAICGVIVGAEGVDTIVVNDIRFGCCDPNHSRPLGRYGGKSGFHLPENHAHTRRIQQDCPRGEVAVGIHGRSGIWVDAVGLICDALQPALPALAVAPVPLKIVKAQGRVKLFDVNALAARGAVLANEDPLASEFRNQQREGPARRGFDIGMAAAEWQTLPGPGKQKIHDSLSPAEQGGFSTAVSFSLVHNRQKLIDLARRGEAIATEDQLALELREQQLENPARRGFDIGMAVAEGQTAPGPGKEKIRGALPDPAEQAGFTTAVEFSLERNRNGEFAAKGATIAKADRSVAVVRAVEADVFYRLGFDIATGIFGNPALGAQGNTEEGPGSNAIRDSLSPAGQRGFNASVALHLNRDYSH